MQRKKDILSSEIALNCAECLSRKWSTSRLARTGAIVAGISERGPNASSFCSFSAKSPLP